MTLDQLRIFLAVAEREHMTRAAEALNLTQSATSAAIAALETRHAVKLFDRVGRRVVLTEAGRVFADEARAVLARAEIAERALDDLAGLRRGTLRLAASQTVANYWLPRLLAQYRAAYPGVTLSMQIGNTEEVAAAVAHLDVDLAVVEGSPGPAVRIEADVAGDRMLLVAAPGGDALPTSADAVRARPWVLREPGSGTRAAFEEWIATLGLTAEDVNIVFEFTSNEAVRNAVEAGAGATVMSDLALGRAVEAGWLRAHPLDIDVRRFRLLRHPERSLTTAERAFRDLVSEAGGAASDQVKRRSPEPSAP